MHFPDSHLFGMDINIIMMDVDFMLYIIPLYFLSQLVRGLAVEREKVISSWVLLIFPLLFSSISLFPGTARHFRFSMSQPSIKYFSKALPVLLVKEQCGGTKIWAPSVLVATRPHHPWSLLVNWWIIAMYINTCSHFHFSHVGWCGSHRVGWDTNIALSSTPVWPTQWLPGQLIRP